MIGYYFTKTLQGSQFCSFCNIIIDIHELKITSYNASRRALFEEQKLKQYKEKEEAQKDIILTGDWDNQGLCWDKLFNVLPMHAWCAKDGTPRTNILCHMYVFSTYLVSRKLKLLHIHWNNLWHISSNFMPFCEMILQMSGNYLMIKYPLVGCYTLIMYNILTKEI